MWVGLLTDRINNKLERSYLVNEHVLNREPVPLRLEPFHRSLFIHLFCHIWKEQNAKLPIHRKKSTVKIDKGPYKKL